METNHMKPKLDNFSLTPIEQIVNKLKKQGINAELCKRNAKKLN